MSKVDITKTVQCADSAKAGEGDKVTVHYGGFLMDGTKFDSRYTLFYEKKSGRIDFVFGTQCKFHSWTDFIHFSFDRARPFTFELGVGQVIPGWDQVSPANFSYLPILGDGLDVSLI